EGEAVAQRWSVAAWWDEVLGARRVAIVGETGSGKTMLLQQLAGVLLARGYLPLWIAVADLQGRRLEDYVLQDWLQQATQRWQVAEALRADVAAQVAAGRVWLLLDGVDEAGEGGTGLGAVGRSLRGWLAPAPVVLTCRLSQWDSGFNPLQGFRVFQNLGLRPGAGGDLQGGDLQGRDPRGGDPRGGDRGGVGFAQQADFVGVWFRAIQQPELGQRLLQELQAPHQRHLQDLVQSPLYLALLCRLWSLTQGQLPPTKASLYQRWVEALYIWHQDRCPTSLQQRWQLNRALGTVAIAALQQPQQPYRLSQTLVHSAIAPHLDRLSLALQLGWLTPIGPVSPSLEPGYRFYHPTFQDYFAAQAVNEARFWLGETDASSPIAPIDRPSDPSGEPSKISPRDRSLREPWRSVLLLWMGRGEVPEAAKEEVCRGCSGCQGTAAAFMGCRVWPWRRSPWVSFPAAPKRVPFFSPCSNGALAPIRPR
ncbi:MAG: NACHT domain-containing protein, partial [Prochlorothrix sp.]